MKLIPLTRGLSAMVDDDDFDFVSRWRWYAQPAGRKVYAARRLRKGEGRGIVLMHRAVHHTPAALLTDHIDGNGLNNQKANLRTATVSQNAMNGSPQRGRSSSLKGAWHDPTSHNRSKWRSAIRIDGRLKYLGRFATEHEAAAAYARAAAEHFGDFHRVHDGAQS